MMVHNSVAGLLMMMAAVAITGATAAMTMIEGTLTSVATHRAMCDPVTTTTILIAMTGLETTGPDKTPR
jgi:hypothetical protein